MAVGLQSLMAGPQQGAAALGKSAAKHRRSIVSTATLGTAATLAVLARHRRSRPHTSAPRPKRWAISLLCALPASDCKCTMCHQGLRPVKVHSTAKFCEPNVPSLPGRFLHPLVLHAISGAVGEVCQETCLYPLSTIAVRHPARSAAPQAQCLLSPSSALSP